MIAFLYVSSSVDSDLYSKCSIRPNVGGVVGLADLYVDPALGFSMGWSAWYNWSITLRTYYCRFYSAGIAYLAWLSSATEITAATVVLNYWQEQSRLQ